MTEASDTAFKRVVALYDPLFLKRKLCRLHRGTEIIFARDGRVEFMRPGEEGNPGVAESGEVIHGFVNSGL